VTELGLSYLYFADQRNSSDMSQTVKIQNGTISLDGRNFARVLHVQDEL